MRAVVADRDRHRPLPDLLQRLRHLGRHRHRTCDAQRTRPSAAEQDAVFSIVEDWPALSPWALWLAIVGTVGWILAVGYLAIAARAAGAPRSEWVFLALAAFFLAVGHPAPFGTIAFGCLFVAALIHVRRASGTHRLAASREPCPQPPAVPSGRSTPRGAVTTPRRRAARRGARTPTGARRRASCPAARPPRGCSALLGVVIHSMRCMPRSPKAYSTRMPCRRGDQAVARRRPARSSTPISQLPPPASNRTNITPPTSVPSSQMPWMRPASAACLSANLWRVARADSRSVERAAQGIHGSTVARARSMWARNSSACQGSSGRSSAEGWWTG